MISEYELMIAAVKTAAREAVREEFKSQNLDGPTHTKHHQAMEDILTLTKYAKKTFVGAVVVGLISLLALGIYAWKANY